MNGYSKASQDAQKWVDDHEKATTKADIQEGLQSVFDKLTPDELARLSKHLNGGAFDVKPVTKDADAIKKSIKALPGLSKFLDKEGGIVVWHAQF